MSDADARTEPTSSEANSPSGKTPAYGILAEYETPSALLRAARAVRGAGLKRWDTYTPYPVHGIDLAMGIRPTRLPFIVLGAGALGCLTAVWLQWYTNAHDFPWIVSGKPFWSIPATIPITFELTVLFAAGAALFSMLILNGLPRFSHPLDFNRRFARSTSDRFFLAVQASDPKFDADALRELLNETEPLSLQDISEDRVSSTALPPMLVYGLVVAAVAALVPLALAAKARASTSRETRLHIIPDMDFQPKMKADRENVFFDDDRVTRLPPPGTVAMGDLHADDEFYRGRHGDAYVTAFPKRLRIDDDLLHRGQQRFGIYCAPCHGLAGDGDGMVAKRAEALAEGTWVPPANLHQDYIRAEPVGKLFDTITHGIRNMPAYGHQIPERDRWAIVAYVRALQLSRAVPIQELTDDQRKALE